MTLVTRPLCTVFWVSFNRSQIPVTRGTDSVPHFGSSHSKREEYAKLIADVNEHRNQVRQERENDPFTRDIRREERRQRGVKSPPRNPRLGPHFASIRDVNTCGICTHHYHINVRRGHQFRRFRLNTDFTWVVYKCIILKKIKNVQSVKHGNAEFYIGSEQVRDNLESPLRVQIFRPGQLLLA